MPLRLQPAVAAVLVLVLVLVLVDQLEHAMFTLYQSEPDFVSKIELALLESLSVIANPQLIQLLAAPFNYSPAVTSCFIFSAFSK